MAVCAVEGPAWSQAFEGEPNTLSFDASYTTSFAKGFRSLGGEEYELYLEDFTYRTAVIAFGLEYATPAPGLSLRLELPVIDPTLTGTNPGAEDDGFKMTDLTGRVRYTLPVHPAEFRIAPSAGVMIPVGDYPVTPVLHAMYGKDLNEYFVALDIGRSFGPALDNMFFNLGYQYTIVESIEEMSDLDVAAPNRSDYSFSLGYFVIPKLLLVGSIVGRHTHGGFSWTEYSMWDADPANWTMDQLTKNAHHDQYPKEKYYILRFTPSFNITDAIGLYGDVFKNIRGASTTSAWGVGGGLRFMLGLGG